MRSRNVCAQQIHWSGRKTAAQLKAVRSPERGRSEEMREEFSSKVKDTLARRVCMICSNRSCRQATAGPGSQVSETLNIGVAAHITAAAEGGPRFDLNLTPEERRSVENGIWLCQNCAKLIDDDPLKYTVAVLHRWKAVAEREALVALKAEAAGQDVKDGRAGELELYDRRLAIYRACRELLASILRDAAVSQDDVRRFDQRTEEARFLLGMTLSRFIDELRRHALELLQLGIKVHDEKRFEHADRPSWIEREAVLLNWAADEYSGLAERFAPVLTLSDVAPPDGGRVLPDRGHEPLRFAGTDPEFEKICQSHRDSGYETHLSLVSHRDGKQRSGWEPGLDPRTGREVRVVFEAGAIKEEHVLLVRRPRQSGSTS